MSKPPSKSRTCPTCFKADKEERDQCVNKTAGMCPPSVALDDRSIEVRCAAPCGGPNGKHLAIPLGNIMKRRQLSNIGACAFDVCRCRVVLPGTTVHNSGPPPIAPADAGGK